MNLLKQLYKNYFTSPIDKAAEIINGAYHYIVYDPEVEALATERALVCAQCPFSKYRETIDIIVGDDQPLLVGYVCTKCNCVLSLKTRSTKATCPKRYWIK